MFPGVLALLERSLRIDCRAWGPHLSRFGLLAAIYLAVIYTVMASAVFGAPGLWFFQRVAWLNLAFMTLTGVGYFSTAITEEKEEDTLGLMLMAGISPLGMLLGKSGGRLIQALFLIAVQYPFTLLAVTLGGVTADQIRATYAGLLSYMVMLAGLGLLCSTLARRNRSASRWLTIVLVVYAVIPLCCMAYLRAMGLGVSLAFRNGFAWVAESCIFIQMGSILTTGFGESIWSHQVVTNLLAGVAGFVLSRVAFSSGTRNPSSEASHRGLLSRGHGWLRPFSPGRAQFDPFVWKDFHFVAGGTAALAIRLFLYPALYVGIGVVVQQWPGFRRSPNPARVQTEMFLTLTLLALILDAAFLISRSLHDEIRSETLPTLVMLPVSIGRILYAKIAGVLPVWLPGPAWLLFGMKYLPEGPECAAVWFWRTGPPLMFAAHLILVPHVAGLAAMFVRRGILPIAIGAGIVAISITGFVIRSVRVQPDDPIVFLIGFGILSACAACHVAIGWRAYALSAR
jgi:ABC-type Na+ efflux pump permease subunit